MDENLISNVTGEQFAKHAYQPTTLYDSDNSETQSLIKVLTDFRPFIEKLRHELRGESFEVDDQGIPSWVQVDKPVFIRLDENNQPIKKIFGYQDVWADGKVKKFPNFINPKTGREEYICNDDAVNSIIQVLKFSGLNQVTPMTNIDENIIRDDLREIQSKIVVMLCVKRKKWGVDKAEYPVICSSFNTIIQDARYRAKDAGALKAVRTVTSRIEQSNEQLKQKSVGERIKSPFG